MRNHSSNFQKQTCYITESNIATGSTFGRHHTLSGASHRLGRLSGFVGRHLGYGLGGRGCGSRGERVGGCCRLGGEGSHSSNRRRHRFLRRGSLNLTADVLMTLKKITTSSQWNYEKARIVTIREIKIIINHYPLKWRGATRDLTFMFWIIANDCACGMICLS